MPNLNGEALYEHVRTRFPSLAPRIIFITGDTVSAASRDFLERIGNRWFGKPFNLDEIEKAVGETLAGLPSQ
jgi:DNA-binding response OmpR family regulator